MLFTPAYRLARRHLRSYSNSVFHRFPLSVFVSATLLIAGCGASSSKTSGPACNQTAKKLVRLAMDDNGVSHQPDELNGVEEELTAQCKNTSWSLERRKCILDAQTQEDTLNCPLD